MQAMLCRRPCSLCMRAWIGRAVARHHVINKPLLVTQELSMTKVTLQNGGCKASMWWQRLLARMTENCKRPEMNRIQKNAYADSMA